MHKGRPVFASSKYTLALLGRGVRPKLDYDLLGHTPVTMILECYSHAGSFHSYKYSAYLWAIKRADERTRTADLLITSDRSAVAEGCTGLQFPHK
jgi:hypothetical protein